MVSTHPGGAQEIPGLDPGWSTQLLRIAQTLEEILADHGALTGLADNDHPQYALDTDLDDHEAAADPHTGYRLESADHSHQSTGLQAGVLALAALPTITQIVTATLAADKTTTSSTMSDVDATDAAITMTTTGGKVLVMWSGPANSGVDFLSMTIMLDTVDGAVMGIIQGIVHMTFFALYSPAAGSHTWKMRFRNTNNVTSVAINGAANANGQMIAIEFKQ